MWRIAKTSHRRLILLRRRHRIKVTKKDGDSMKRSLILALTVGALLLCAQDNSPRLTGVEPETAKAGDTLTANGENLNKPNLVDLFLTDGTKDYKVVISEQSGTAVKFKVPANVPAGRFALMVLTGGKEPKLMEQPVKGTIQQERPPLSCPPPTY